MTRKGKKFLVLLAGSVTVGAILMTCIHFRKGTEGRARSRQMEEQTAWKGNDQEGKNVPQKVEVLFQELNEAVNLMGREKDGMPEELLSVHQYLMERAGANEVRFYQIPPELEEFIMVHGVKREALYVDPSVKLEPKIWIPLLYHEAAHLYWHEKHPTATFEEFQARLFDSELYSYTVDAQAWNTVERNFPVERGNLSTKGKELYDLYERETSVYDKARTGDPDAEEEWLEIIEQDVKAQKEKQGLFRKLRSERQTTF